MVVVGNGNGVLGWGQGKAAEANDAVQKAYQRACRNLFPVPRYNDHTIPHAINSKYGQVRRHMGKLYRGEALQRCSSSVCWPRLLSYQQHHRST